MFDLPSPFVNLESKLESNRSSPPYVYDPDTLRAVKVAGAIGRVLLVRGPPGTGKTTLARNVANALGWDYIEYVVTSRTEARDLLWSFDNVERLNDAYAAAVDRSERVRDRLNYVSAGPLFRAFDPALARSFLKPPPVEDAAPGAVVLIDEIDKADPDLPNDLLTPLEARQFPVEPLAEPVRAKRPVFVVVATNEERDLPQAFLRRCVVATLKRPETVEVLLPIARSHFPELDQSLFHGVFESYKALGDAAAEADLRPPGTAEFLDALRACDELGIKAPTDGEFALTINAALWKHSDAGT